MTREQREIVNRIAEALLEITASQRPAALEALCAGLDPDVDTAGIRAEVERLLAEDEALPERLAQIAVPTKSGTRSDAPAATGDAMARVPPIIGRYHIRSPLGQGGMGQVFLAEQRSPIRRLVAVKLIATGLESFEILRRFEAERQALARMDHPHIARVLDAGLTDAGRPYFVMEYVNGKPITTFATEQNLSLRSRLELFALVCDAVAHAHTKGVIHRDLKPSNVLAFYDDHGSPSVKVIDFGIAKAVTSDRNTRVTGNSHLTEAGVTVGTYEYMSPEQAGLSHDIDTRADVYSLGVLLYELLAGVRPFERQEDSPAATDELRRMVREDDAPRPSSQIRSLGRSTVSGTDADELIRTLRRELEWIPLIALRKERERRYAGPAEMAIDIRNYLADRPLIAAPESRWYRLRKFVSHYRVGLLVAAVTLLLLIAGITGTTLGMIRAEAARKLADANGLRASRSAYRSAIVAAEIALRNGDSIRLRQALAAAPAELRGWEWNYFNNLGDTFAVTLQRESGDRFAVTTALPDNRRALSATNTLGGTTVLWDLVTGKILRRETGGIFAVDRAGTSLAILRPDGTLELVDLETGSRRWHAPPPRADRPWTLSGACFTTDGNTLVACDGSTDTVTFFDVATGASRRIVTGVPLEYTLGFAFFENEPDKVIFVPVGSLGYYTLDPRTGITAREPRVDYLFSGVPFHGVGDDLWSPTDRPEGAPVFFCDYLFSSGGANIYLPAHRILALGRDDGSVDLIRANGDAAPNRMTQRLIAGAERVYQLAVTPDESHLIVTLATGEVGVMSVDPAPQVNVPLHGVFGAAVAPDQSKVAGGAWGLVQCVDALTGLPLWGRNLGPENNRLLAWSPDGSYLLVVTSARETGEADVFKLDGNTGNQLAAWCSSPVTLDPAHTGQSLDWARNVAGICFDPTGTTLYVSHTDGSLSRVNASTWSIIDSIKTDEWKSSITFEGEFFADLKISPDGSTLAQMTTITPHKKSALGPLTIRDAGTGQFLRRIDRPGMGAVALAFSPDSSTLAVSFSDPTQSRLLLVDPRTGQVIFDTPLDSIAPIRSISFTHDGQRIAVFTQAMRAVLLDSSSGQIISSPFTTEAVNAAAHTADGSLLVSGGGTLLQRAESHRPAALPDAFFARWPASIPRPASVADARRQIARAYHALQVAHFSERSMPQFLSDLRVTDASTADLAAALEERLPPSINMLNSEALSVLISANPTPVALSRAREMLIKAVAIKPHSANLNANLGTVLFAQQDYVNCVQPLETSERLRAERDLPPSAMTLLRLAIATRSLNDPRAGDFLELARQAIRDQALDTNPEVILLQKQLDEATPAN